MPRLKVTILSFCLLLGSLSIANGAERHRNAGISAARSANRSFPNPFRTVKRLFRRLLGRDKIICSTEVANVDKLVLSKTEIVLGFDTQMIEIFTEASDPENDVLTYQYVISAGKIVGTGKRVTWDLTNAAPGAYTITAGVHDGIGILGRTKTVRVEIYKGDTYPLRETE